MAIYGRRRGGLGNTIRLGLRLARAGGRVRMALVVFGAMVGSVLILISFSIQHALDQQWERTMDRTPYYSQERSSEEVDELFGEYVEETKMFPRNEVDGSSTLHVDTANKAEFGISDHGKFVLISGEGPVPPGISDIPGPGQAYLSPAMIKRLETSTALVNALEGIEIKEVTKDGLLHPGELVLYLGVEASELDSEGLDNGPVLSWGVDYGSLTTYLNPYQGSAFPIFAFMLLPAVVLLATTTRLASSVRTERMAALRLLGVGRTRTQLIAGIEAGTLAVVGVLAGTALIPLIGRLTAGREFFMMQWFASDFRPSLTLFIVTLAFIPLLTALTSLIVLRKIASNPLQIRRKAANPRPSFWRLMPLLLGAIIAGLLIARVYRKLGEAETIAASYTFLLAAILLGLGILLALPVLVRRLAGLLGRKTSRSTLLLAARRTQYEPAVLNRLVGGLVLVLFIATGGQAVVLAFESTPQYKRAAAAITGENTSITVIPARVETPQEPASDVTSADLQTLTGVEGVDSFAVTTLFGDFPEYGQMEVLAIVATCAQMHGLGEFDGECIDGKPMALNKHFGTPTKLEFVDAPELEPIGSVDAPEHFEATIPIPELGILLPPNLAQLAALGDAKETWWVLDVPADDDLWAQVEAELFTISPNYWVTVPDLYPLEEVENVRTGIWFGTAVAGSIALITLLITAIDNSIARRPQIAMQRAFGVSLGRVRRTQVLQALLPLAVGVPLAGATGILAGQAYTKLNNMTITTSYWSAIGIALGLAAVAAVCVSLATLPAIGGKISPQSLRKE